MESHAIRCPSCTASLAGVPVVSGRLECPGCGALCMLSSRTPPPVTTRMPAARPDPGEITGDETVDMVAPAETPSLPAPDPATPFSSQFLERYRFVRLLGKGAMGAVYLMHQTRLDRLVAVKVVAKSEITRDDARRLEREARHLATLNHPNIVAVNDVGTDNGSPYLVMEYVEGETLSSRLKRDPPLTLAQSLKLMLGILAGVKEAHDQCVVHRDLKPDNILISVSGKPKIADFGLAKSQTTTSGTLAGLIMGTPPYMSPEQCHSRGSSASSDLYSLGCILFEMVTGRRPFLGPDVLDYLTQHTTEPPPSLRSICPDLPDQLEEIVMTALAKEPEQRFETVRTFRKALLDLSRSISAGAPANAPSRPQQGPATGTYDDASGRRSPPAAAALKPASLLAGHYRLVRPLGAGEMGQVWLARDESRDGMEFVLKTLSPELWRDPETRETLRYEAKLAEKLAHPNIVRLVTLESSEPQFLVLEFIAGPTLEADLADRRQNNRMPYTAAGALPLIEGLAQGLDHAHAMGLVHRDINPSNVILAPQAGGTFAAKLMDFGIAAEVANHRMRLTGVMPMSTLSYMSPEQLACQKLDRRTDVYSLGATLYEMLTLCPPFPEGDVARAILEQPVRKPAGMDDAVFAVLAAALAKKRESRPASAGELFRRLHQALRPDATPAPLTPGTGQIRASAPRGVRPRCIEAYALGLLPGGGIFTLALHAGYRVDRHLALAQIGLQLALSIALLAVPGVQLWRGSERVRKVLLGVHAGLLALTIVLIVRGEVGMFVVTGVIGAAGLALLSRPAAAAFCSGARTAR